MTHPFDLEVAIVGAGPAGIGVGVALEELDIEYALLEREAIGASFRQWPAEMRLLTPSFPANSFGARDLNAITPDTSPALALDCEHPTGPAYAEYLEAVADFHELPIRTGVDVETVIATNPGFRLETTTGPITAQYVIWAAGQYQYPTDGEIAGATHGRHVAAIDSWVDYSRRIRDDLEAIAERNSATEYDEVTDRRVAADGSTAAVGAGAHEPETSLADVVIIGGYESGIDGAISLAGKGLSVTVLDEDGPWQFRDPDPSEVLSPRTNVSRPPWRPSFRSNCVTEPASTMLNPPMTATRSSPPRVGGFTRARSRSLRPVSKDASRSLTNTSQRTRRMATLPLPTAMSRRRPPACFSSAHRWLTTANCSVSSTSSASGLPSSPKQSVSVLASILLLSSTTAKRGCFSRTLPVVSLTTVSVRDCFEW